MGNELASYDKSYSSASDAAATDATAYTPGRSSLAQSQDEGEGVCGFEAISPAETEVAQVGLRAGVRVIEHRFEYVAQSDGTFLVDKAPVGYKHSEGRKITREALPESWHRLHALVMATPATAAVPPAAPKKAAKARVPRPAFGSEEMKANDQRVRKDPKKKQQKPTDPEPLLASRGTTLEVAETKAKQGDAGTHYSTTVDTGPAFTGSAAATSFYCSSFAMWTLAAAGYNLEARVLGADGVPFSYTAIQSKPTAAEAAALRSPRLVKLATDAGFELLDTQYVQPSYITFRKLIDSDQLAVRFMGQVEREAIVNGKHLGVAVHPGPFGREIMDELIGNHETTSMAGKGIAGAFEALGIGNEVPETTQKPGDFAQIRRKEQDGTHHGAGHCFQVWSVDVKGDAMFGEARSPKPVAGELDGWNEQALYRIDKDTDPLLVGTHTVVSAMRVEANEARYMNPKAPEPVDKAGGKPKAKEKGGDGGVQITGERPVPCGELIFYGRLGGSPWAQWSPATKPSAR